MPFEPVEAFRPAWAAPLPLCTDVIATPAALPTWAATCCGIVFIAILAHDVWKALWFADTATGRVGFGVGVGTLILLLNVVLLSGYVRGDVPSYTGFTVR